MAYEFVGALLGEAADNEAFQRALSQVKAGAGRIVMSGLTPAARALHLSLLQKRSQKTLLILVNDNRAGEELQQLLRAFDELLGPADPEEVAFLPAYDVLPFQNMSPHPEIMQARSEALWRISGGRARYAIAPYAASAILLRDKNYYASLAVTLRKGDMTDMEMLSEQLGMMGYYSVEAVETPGEYAVRGGILDVFAPQSDEPCRIELFGDEIESLRGFDVETQRSTEDIEELLLAPLSEMPATESTLSAIHARLSGHAITENEQEMSESARQRGVTIFPGWEFFAPLAGARSTFFDLAKDAVVVVDEPGRIAKDFAAWWARIEEAHEKSLIGNLARPEELYTTPERWQAIIAGRCGVDLEELPVVDERERVEIASLPGERFHGDLPKMLERAKERLAAGERVIASLSSRGELERLADLCGEHNVVYRLGSALKGDDAPPPTNDAAQALILLRADAPDGFVLTDEKLVFYGERDLFDEASIGSARPQRKRSKRSAFLSDFRDLAVGDYVVHVEHGVGEYLGLKQMPRADGGVDEFMLLGYADGARLYVPLTRLDQVQKFRSQEGAKATLNRLGTQQWAKTKAKVKRAMRDMTDELLKLYAARKTAKGYAFSADDQHMREFEEAFEYVETEDQLAAIADIKRDMESDLPMDRLLCGDVGYGKTEVAMRAAFKAVNDGKQVAVLAPTTVLAFQHYETFKRRFAAFPVNVDMVSRFRGAKQISETIENLAAGKVDILVGTHRVLSKDVVFPDLGLVIIDEEQRFGVRHKERLKQLRREVDVLAMSATPIPRTLHMSLAGMRDMSVIETPPKDRMAINTVVSSWSDKLIQQSIRQELERGGQAYFVHNRVETIFEMAAQLQQLLPEARILVGHGQMNQGELEKVMLGFMRHEADVLVATTIIENGLDIPLCNTMIVNRADRHGLSELYQLRGRVGRSNRRAYAYLLAPPQSELSDLARRRLAALKEFSDLGAGFKIAALDLELRGAGNLLGGEQSGHIEAVGFELYTQMLEQAMAEMKGDAVVEELDVQLNLGLNIRIPNEYIPQENQRLRMYKRVAGARDEKALADAAAELRDRYGDPPAEAQLLLLYAALKLECQALGVAAVERKRQLVSIKFTQSSTADPARIMNYVSRSRGAQFTPQGTLNFTLKATQPAEMLQTLRQTLKSFAPPAEATA